MRCIFCYTKSFMMFIPIGDLKPRQWRGEADAAFINGPDDPEALRVILYNLPMTRELKAILKEKIGVQ